MMRRDEYRIARKLGRLSSGLEPDKGAIWHVVPQRKWYALCGEAPGHLSGGWSADEGDDITCLRCRRKLEK
jgi:hypothetical protein